MPYHDRKNAWPYDPRANWPTPPYPLTEADQRRARRAAIRQRVGLLILAAGLAAFLAWGC